jgi:hypothetical protein
MKKRYHFKVPSPSYIFGFKNYRQMKIDFGSKQLDRINKKLMEGL